MKVIEIKELENCFDGSFMREALIDTEITNAIIMYLSEDNELEYHPDFARPFYKVTRKGVFIIKGVEGNKTMRLILNRKDPEHAEECVIEKINTYNFI